jgi:hypothetical protein
MREGLLTLSYSICRILVFATVLPLVELVPEEIHRPAGGAS